MKLVVLITAQIENGLEIAHAWREIGAPGVTILRGYGLQSLEQKVQRRGFELPRLAATMATVLASVDPTVEMVLAVVRDDLVDLLIDKANDILGDLVAADTGIAFVIDVDRAFGVHHFGD